SPLAHSPPPLPTLLPTRRSSDLPFHPRVEERAKSHVWREVVETGGSRISESNCPSLSACRSKRANQIRRCDCRRSQLLPATRDLDRKSPRLNSSHRTNSYAVFCL